MTGRGRYIAATVTALAMAAVPAQPAQAHPRSWFSNCTEVNRHWPHGIGKVHAHDQTSGEPVRNFKHNTRLYRHAVSINGTLDRDGDKIACEKL